jgi:hypothetical protein
MFEIKIFLLSIVIKNLIKNNIIKIKKNRIIIKIK